MNHLDFELQHLKTEMTEMAELVKSQIAKSIEALTNLDKDLAREVIFNEKRVNAFELKIDKDCENIFALFSPVANDLRFVFSTLKINTNYERTGDNAEGIAHYVLQAKEKFRPDLIDKTRLLEMANIVNNMIEDVCKAYSYDDTRLARSVFERDSVLNEINKSATTVIADYIRHDQSNIEDALYLLTIIRKLERVGDQITNIAEEVIFYVEAKVLKHGKKHA